MAEEYKMDVRESSTSKDTDVEKALQRIAKEEALVIASIRQGSKFWRNMSAKLIMFFVAVEVIFVVRLVFGFGFGFWAMRNLEMKFIALVVFLMSLPPALFFIAYAAARRLNRMFDRIDNKALGKLQAERQAILQLEQSYNHPTGNSNGVEAATTTTGVRSIRKVMAEESKKDVWESSISKDPNVEKALQQIAKEEASVLANISWRYKEWRDMVLRLTFLTVVAEVLSVICVVHGFWTMRSRKLTWKMGALIVSPMFLTPAIIFIGLLALRSMERIFDWMDERALRKLRAKRQAKIDELKEKANDHTTERYNPPTGKTNGVEVARTTTGVRRVVGRAHEERVHDELLSLQ